MSMKKKQETEANVTVTGLDDIFSAALDAENMLCKYERFAEHVILACGMPEIPRYTMRLDSIEETLMPQAFDLLDRLLVRYRKMTSWMRKNGIDPESVAGETDEKKTHN